jgi:hypothetical protein
MADGSMALDESGWYSIVIEDSRIDELTQVLADFKETTLQGAIYLEIQRDIEMRYV